MTTPGADLSQLRIRRDEPRSEGSPLKWVLIALLLAFIALAVWYLKFREPAALDVTVAQVETSGGAGNGGTGITANGYVTARTRASVSSRITGRVVELLVEEGSVVRKGEIMARLENADYIAMVAQAVADSARGEAGLREIDAQLGQLQRDLSRAQALVSQNLEAKRVAEDLGSQVDAAKARREVQLAINLSGRASTALARVNLENTFIRAPFDGTVLRKDAEEGEVVAPVAGGGGLTRGAVVTMANLSTLEVEVDVNEAYIAQIRNGQPTKVVLDAYPNVSFNGKVRQIVPTADRQRATVQVKVSITERDKRILPEMGARVDFLAEAKPGEAPAPIRLLVPGDAVVTDSGATIVWVIRDGKVNRTPIEAGPVSGGKRQVTTGLTGGEQIVVKPPQGLKQGARVNVSK